MSERILGGTGRGPSSERLRAGGGWFGDRYYSNGFAQKDLGIEDRGSGIADSGFRIQDSGFRIQDGGLRSEDGVQSRLHVRQLVRWRESDSV